MNKKYADESGLLNAYKVFLGLGNKIINGLSYYSEIKAIEGKSEIYNISPIFWNSMAENSFYSALNCLILLYDRDKRSLTLESFLESLEDKLKTKPASCGSSQVILSQVKQHLSDLRSPPLNSLIDNLILLRIKKHFHLDFDNIVGKLHANTGIDPDAVLLTFPNIFSLKDKAIKIIENLGPVFNINPKDFIILHHDYQNLFSDLSILFSVEKMKRKIEMVNVQKEIKSAKEKYTF